MDGILTTPTQADTRKFKQWLEDQIYELEAQRSGNGFSLHQAGQLAFARRVLERTNHGTR